MSTRYKIHDRNIYRYRPDFLALAKAFPYFKKYLSTDEERRCCFDFEDTNAVRALDKILMIKDFNLKVEFPNHFLVPTLHRCLNYILWIEDLLCDIPVANQDIKGINIGSGPCCLLASLGARKNEWSYLATEFSDESVKLAQNHIEKNNLNDKIKVIKVDKDSSLKDVVGLEEGTYDFCICNPPFFENMEELTRKGYFNENNTEETEKNAELIRKAEVTFLKKLIEDSQVLKEKVRLYSTMFGRRGTYKTILRSLRKLEGISINTVEFFDGETLRFGIAWTFLNSPLTKKKKSKLPKKAKPYTHVIPNDNDEISLNETVKKLEEFLMDYEINYKIKSQTMDYAELLLQSDKDTWSVKNRKRILAQRSKELSLKNSNETTVNSNAEEKIEDSTKTDEQNETKEILSGQKRALEDDQSNAQCSKILKTDSSKKEILSCDFDVNNIKVLLYGTVKFMRTSDSLYIEFSCPNGANRNTMHQVFLIIKNSLWDLF